MDTPLGTALVKTVRSEAGKSNRIHRRTIASKRPAPRLLRPSRSRTWQRTPAHRRPTLPSAAFAERLAADSREKAAFIKALNMSP